MFETIGRYRVQEKLGEGAMAEVYKAYDPSIDRTLAIKVLREERCSDPEYRARFLRESKAAGILSHANIATVYDVGEIEERPYIVMEYLEGEPLDEVMRSGEKFTLKKIVTYGIQLSKALGYAHQKGIVHRDVKPGNIVRLKNSSTIKVMDFGIARMESKEVTQQTQMGEVLGTPQYMSPEQVLGQTVDARSDLFSLGVILYQLITGQKPFEADTLGTLLFRIATENPKPIGDLAPTVTQSVQRIVDKLLAKKPEKRYQNGQEVTDALIKALKEIEEAERTREMHRIIPLRVRWSIAMALVVAVTMVISGSVIYKRQYRLMLGQLIANGSSLVKFVAVESAVPVLSEDWVAIELFVNDVVARQNFAYLQVMDHKGVVRGSSQKDQIGKPYQAPAAATELPEDAGVAIATHDSGGEPVISFAAPILFQNREIGRVRLGIPQAPFKKVVRTTIWMLAVLMAVTIAAAMGVTYLLGNLLGRPIRIVVRALDEIRDGNLDHRIAEQRNDEFGSLYLAFDRMADALQGKDEEEPQEAEGGSAEPADSK